METKTFKNVDYGDYVHCNDCENDMLLPHGADRCPLCGTVGSLSWTDKKKQKADVFNVHNAVFLNRQLKRSDYTSAAQMWQEDFKKYGTMTHSDIYEMCQKVRRQEQAELKAALEAHGGSFTWLNSLAERYNNVEYDIPIIAVNRDEGPIDVVISKAWLESGYISLSAQNAIDGTDVYIDVSDVFPGHLCYLIDCMTATAEVSDVSLKL